ncbi:rod shape-determining protein MreC [Breznakibacter xylanolyticus]|uniref:Cell shape-determining protein MreC n=1 Tax=Breznakibacter xylanolyticus TaxID=990 RepID=A0A2W7NA28_9BACT|nr:rod shape-determining protein MreC [Breznakibacter xylanolyticus]PZX16860.1 rod shape-determining protein MreC [Breznakibacter xylanolyticus]
MQHHVGVLFVFLEILSLILVFRYNPYHRSVFVSSSNRLSGALYEGTHALTHFFSLQRDNDRLADENAFLKSRLPGAFQMSPNYIRLVKDSLTGQQYAYHSARVINNSVNKSFNYLTLDKGSIDGIRQETAVICPDGIVGVVRRVSPHFTSVISLLNSRLKISGKLKESGHFGSVSWDGTDSRYVNLSEIPLHATVKPGDLIVTSGYSAIFPEGIPIGTVDEVEAEEGESFFRIRVKLAVDFKRLSYVEVVDNTYRGEQLQLEKQNEND